MTLSAPTQIVFIISVILVVLAVVGFFVAIPVVSVNAFWIAIAGFVLLMLGNLLPNL